MPYVGLRAVCHPLGASICLILRGPLFLWTLSIVNTGCRPESELLGWNNTALSGASGGPETAQQFWSFSFFLNAGCETASRHLSLLPNKRILMESPWMMRLSPEVLPCRDCFCCLVVSCVAAAFVFGFCRERHSKKEVSFTLVIPLPAKWIQTSNVMTPILFHTFSMFDTVSSHIAGPGYISKQMKMSFCPGRWACVVGRGRGRGTELWWRCHGHHQSFKVCLWMPALLTSSVGFAFL